MAINLSKKAHINEYYFLKDNIQFGPFDVATLLIKITRDSLVSLDGKDWSRACDVTELQKFFPDKIHKQIVTDQTSSSYSNDSDFLVKEEMFTAPFSFDGRIRRKEYGISLIIYFVGYSMVLGLSESSAIFGLVMIPLLWFLYAQGTKRCHDKGNPGWYQLIPFYVFWLLFSEGDKEPNKYGNSPK